MGEIQKIGDALRGEEAKVEGFFKAHVAWTSVGSAVSAALLVLAAVAFFHI